MNSGAQANTQCTIYHQVSNVRFSGVILFVNLGTWSNPEVIGRCGIFINSFVMEKLSNTRAIVFGGVDNDTNNQGSSVYLLEISISTVASRVVCRLHVYVHHL